MTARRCIATGGTVATGPGRSTLTYPALPRPGHLAVILATLGLHLPCRHGAGSQVMNCSGPSGRAAYTCPAPSQAPQRSARRRMGRAAFHRRRFAGLPGFLPAGYAAVKGTAAVPSGLVATTPDACLGVALSDGRRGRHLRCSWRPVLGLSSWIWTIAGRPGDRSSPAGRPEHSVEPS